MILVVMSACLLLWASIPGEGLPVVLPYVSCHHGHGLVVGRAGGGGGGGGVPGVTGAVLTGADCRHHLSLLPGGVHEYSPDTVSGHGCGCGCDCGSECSDRLSLPH